MNCFLILLLFYYFISHIEKRKRDCKNIWEWDIIFMQEICICIEFISLLIYEKKEEPWEITCRSSKKCLFPGSINKWNKFKHDWVNFWHNYLPLYHSHISLIYYMKWYTKICRIILLYDQSCLLYIAHNNHYLVLLLPSYYLFIF